MYADKLVASIALDNAIESKKRDSNKYRDLMDNFQLEFGTYGIEKQPRANLRLHQIHFLWILT